MHHSLGVGLALACCLAWVGSSARAESSLEMTLPAAFGPLEAGTYAQSGDRVGDGHLAIEKLENGHVQILSQVGIKGGASTIAQAILAPVGEGRALRLLRQESRSIDTDGRALDFLSIDHVKRLASCSSRDQKKPSVRTLELPEEDRVVNVAMHLLFEPLVRGDVEAVDFEFFVCRPRPYIVSFQARVSRRVPATEDAHEIVEIAYEPRGGFVAMIVRQFAPRLVFWFDPARANPWIAHRMPLYSSGPDVVVLRDGISLERLENGD